MLREIGCSATPVDAFDLGLISDSNHGCARPIAGQGALIRRALEQIPGIPVVTGFLAKDQDGHLTTLGRNGSDLSASLLGEAALACEVQFWKAVGGVFSADPKWVSSARHLSQLSYAQAAEYAHCGANVLHPGALEPLERANLPARVLSVLEPDKAGTLITRALSQRGAVGLGLRRGAALVQVELGATQDPSAQTAAWSARLAQAQLEPLWLLRSARELGLALVWSEAAAHFFALCGEPVRVQHGLAIVALVGPTPDEVSAAAAALSATSIPVRAHWTAPGGSSALFAVDDAQVPAALRCVHAAVFESPIPSTSLGLAAAFSTGPGESG
jgi:aspartate kinase